MRNKRRTEMMEPILVVAVVVVVVVVAVVEAFGGGRRDGRAALAPGPGQAQDHPDAARRHLALRLLLAASQRLPPGLFRVLFSFPFCLFWPLVRFLRKCLWYRVLSKPSFEPISKRILIGQGFLRGVLVSFFPSCFRFPFWPLIRFLRKCLWSRVLSKPPFEPISKRILIGQGRTNDQLWPTLDPQTEARGSINGQSGAVECDRSLASNDGRWSQ